MSGTTIQQNPLGLSDEDFLNQPTPDTTVEVVDPVADPVVDPVAEAEPATTADDPPASADANADEGGADDKGDTADTEKVSDGTGDEAGTDGDGQGGDPKGDADPSDDGDAGATDPVGSDAEAGAKEGNEPASGDPKADPDPVQETDYKGFYEKVLAPLKANGKTIEIRSAEEAIQLMQMGANYTRKLQDIAPYRKHLMMLERHDLLDQDKLSYLIDLDRKDPAAIRKLLKDSNIDPLEIDMEDKTEYLGGNHTVTDEEAAFRTTLEELTSSKEGAETVRLVHDTWDQSSKDIVWSQPNLLNVIHSQRANGIYDQIVSELERQQVLGQIPTNTPFIQAYQHIGNQLFRAGQEQPATVAKPSQADPVVEPPKPVATTVTAPKDQAINGDKAKAAGSVRTEPRKATPLVNPFSMSDDEFLRKFENRL